jgi:hypothetical protein
MTSDHRLAGSSHSGCKPGSRADNRAKISSHNSSSKTALSQSLARFSILLDSRTCHMRTSPRNLLICGYALSLRSTGINTANMYPTDTLKRTKRNAAAIGNRRKMQRRYALLQITGSISIWSDYRRAMRNCRCRMRLQKSTASRHSSLRAGLETDVWSHAVEAHKLSDPTCRSQISSAGWCR